MFTIRSPSVVKLASLSPRCQEETPDAGHHDIFLAKNYQEIYICSGLDQKSYNHGIAALESQI